MGSGSAGANTLTGYLDRDIDAVMNRTKKRPIPSRRITAKKALLYGLTLSILATLLALALNPLAALLMIAGLVDNVIIYSRVLKRRSPTNIILGGFSGGMPVLIGYAAVTGTIDLASIILAALVFLWIPSHIWSLALHSKDDYLRANVPMLPVVVQEKVAIISIGVTSVLMVAFSLMPILYNLGPGFGPVYMISAFVLGVATVALTIWLVANPSRDRAWVFFKFTSPYLTLLFIGMMVDASFAA